MTFTWTGPYEASGLRVSPAAQLGAATDDRHLLGGELESLMMRVQCLLWDFGDTLCDELSLWRASPEWMEVYRSFDEQDGIGAAWSLGDLDTDEVAAKLAERMALSAAEIHAHLSRTDLFEFFPFTYAFFRARHLPQAIVTVNPAQFRAMAQDLAFEEVTDTIVVSAEEDHRQGSALRDRSPAHPDRLPERSSVVDRQQAVQYRRLGATRRHRVSVHNGFCLSPGRRGWHRWPRPASRAAGRRLCRRDAMKRTWTIIGVSDVPASLKWYQSLFGQPATAPAHADFGQLVDSDGTVLLCLHEWGAHEHPSLTSPDHAQPGNGLLLFFRVDDFDTALPRARALVARLEEEPHVNPNTGTAEFSLRDPDGYYVTISAL